MAVKRKTAAEGRPGKVEGSAAHVASARQRAATVGVAEHGNSAVLVTVAPGGGSSIAGAST